MKTKQQHRSKEIVSKDHYENERVEHIRPQVEDTQIQVQQVS